MRTLNDLKERRRERHGRPTRKTKQAMYNSRRWKRYREEYRARHPLCIQCQEQGITKPMWAIDHVIPHGGNETLFWNPKNHQPLCLECHNRKSQQERAGT